MRCKSSKKKTKWKLLGKSSIALHKEIFYHLEKISQGLEQ